LVASSFDSVKWKRSDGLYAIFLISSLELIGRWFVYHGNESTYIKSEGGRADHGSLSYGEHGEIGGACLPDQRFRGIQNGLSSSLLLSFSEG
jgi:hypothetical protein